MCVTNTDIAWSEMCISPGRSRKTEHIGCASYELTYRIQNTRGRLCRYPHGFRSRGKRTARQLTTVVFTSGQTIGWRCSTFSSSTSSLVTKFIMFTSREITGCYDGDKSVVVQNKNTLQLSMGPSGLKRLLNHVSWAWCNLDPRTWWRSPAPRQQAAWSGHLGTGE